MDNGQFLFGEHRLDAASGTLIRSGKRVVLPPKVAELFIALVQAAGTVLKREELQQRLWPDRVVEDGSLTSHISWLRKAWHSKSIVKSTVRNCRLRQDRTRLRVETHRVLRSSSQ
jgi:DNA-binding winged helix-turn-helix (wHTH) protein